MKTEVIYPKKKDISYPTLRKYKGNGDIWMFANESTAISIAGVSVGNYNNDEDIFDGDWEELPPGTQVIFTVE